MDNQETSNLKEAEATTRELSVPEALALAIRLHQSGLLLEAERIYLSILEIWPDFPDALHFLGLLRHQQGDSGQAIALMGRAIEICPDYADAYNNLGNVYNSLDRFEEAVAAYGKALELVPENPTHWANLGVALKELARYEEAVAAFGRALEADPANPVYLQNLGNVYRKMGNLGAAAEMYRQAIAQKPHNPSAYKALLRTLYVAGEYEEAVKLIGQWLVREPDNPIALHMRSAYTGEAVPERAADRYVEETFNAFAESFDTVLRRLDYQAPRWVAGAVAEVVAPKAELDILDAGCGTGLCGPLLRPFAKRLVGVDLSPGMLARAKLRGDYDELVHAELTAFIEARREDFDLIVSADTLVYFGELEPVLKAAFGTLRAGGHLVFTLEKEERTADAGFRLNPHGRYSHTASYVRARLRETGFMIQGLKTATLRTERAEPVAGWVVCAAKP